LTIKRFVTFRHSVLSTLKLSRPLVEHVSMTLHGGGFGHDEAEAFRSQVAGVFDAVAAQDYLTRLRLISIIERDAEAAKHIKGLLATILPSGAVGDAVSDSDSDSRALGDARAQLGSVGHNSRAKPHILSRCLSPRNTLIVSLRNQRCCGCDRILV
jgi:hypothetical protein